MTGNGIVHEKLAQSVRTFQILYDKSSKDFKDKHKKERAWKDVAREVGFPSGKLVNMDYFFSLICWDFRTGNTFEQAGFNFFNVCRVSCLAVLITSRMTQA